MDNKNFKTVTDSLKNGSIMQSYGSKYLISISPAPSIHKVKWSIVELNTGGKVFSNFFMSMEQMRQLCDEIEKGIASKKLAADKESSYPGAYKYVTGENGSKKLNIGGGQKGIRVQIQENKDGKWDNKMSVISIQDFVQMKFLFFLTMGLETFVKGSYYGGLYEAFWEGETKRAEYFSKSYSEKDDGETSEVPSEEPKAEVVDAVESVVSTKPITPDTPEEKPASTPEVAEKAENCQMTTLRMKVVKELSSEANGRAKLTALTEKGHTVHVWFDSETVSDVNIWNKFKPIGEHLGSIITATGIRKEMNFLVKELAL